MAKQHFYCRVPARVSMYNRSDGFDTFAHSAGLDREFIERELSSVYENKLGKNDTEAVRKGLMPLVYSQCCLRSGSLVQACIRYLARDYTGERSAYLCHSLILSDEERALLLHSRENAPFNPQMFVTDTDRFDFTSPEAVANSQYPEKTYVPCPVADPKELLQKYDPDIIKKFLFSILSVLCAKGKTVYFKLPCADAEVSAEALRFIGSVMAVIPCHMREGLSFVTYVTDPAQYGPMKLKCVSENAPEIPAAKGVFFDFRTGLVTGLPAEDVIAKAPVGFFCSLLEDTAIRNEFLLFIENAVKTMPNLERLNMKTLSDLVFLFGGASGLFSQQAILPNDGKVYDFLCIYEKYRAALSQEYRRNVYKCLDRYPENHQAIPKNIFAKLSRLYPTEASAAKRIAMNTVLELIHTDIMRDKLFTFIKNNYDSEDPDIRVMISADLCRVFYGGFLQTQILSFFSDHFANEPEQTQNAVFEKLMLTIRTEAVQPKILEFLVENYANLSAGQKQHFYDTFFEMLPECDALAASLIRLVNGKIEEEPQERKQQVCEMLAQLLETDSRKKEHKLMPLLCQEPGFCCDTAVRLVFGPWNGRKIFAEYMALLTQKDVTAKTEALLRVFDTVPDMDEAVQGKLILALESLYAADSGKANLYDYLAADRMAEEKLSSETHSFAYLFRVKVTQPAIADALFDALDTKLHPDGVQVVLEYAKRNPYLTETESYKQLQVLLHLQDAAAKKDAKTVFLCLKVLEKNEAAKSPVAGYIRTGLLKASRDPGQMMLYLMCVNALKKGVFLSESVYLDCKELFVQQLQEKDPAANGAKIGREGACRTAEAVLQNLITACKTNTAFAEAICGDAEGLDMFLRSFAADCGKGAGKWIVSHLTEAPAELMAAIRKHLDGIKPQGGNLFAKLFGRK